MCGRYENLIAREAYRALFHAARLPESNFPPRYNIAPTDQIPIVRIDPRDQARELVMARWGLIPFWMTEKPKVHALVPFCGLKTAPTTAGRCVKLPPASGNALIFTVVP